jgi:hypothetical protein
LLRCVEVWHTTEVEVLYWFSENWSFAFEALARCLGLRRSLIML